MADTPAPAPPADDPKPCPFSFTLKTAVYHLSGPAGPGLDMLVASAVRLWLTVKRSGENRYLLTGRTAALIPYATWINEKNAPHKCEFDAPTGVSFNIERAGPPRGVRQVEIVGDGNTHLHVRLAIDHGLTASAGSSIYRFNVTGTTSRLVSWLMAALKKPRADVLAMLAIDEAAVVAEDRIALDPHAVRIDLPTRTTKSEIKHDAEGRIVSVVQTEETSED